MGRTDRWAELATISALTTICLLLPTHNSTLDAWYYAACVRHGHELLLPHHLLYNAAGGLWVRGWQALPGGAPDTLAALKVLNALVAGASLAVLRPLLRLVLGPQKPSWPWLLLVGASFAMLRFATENEAYLPPLLLSLLASRAWARYQLRGRRLGQLAGAGLWAALACLFHQIHFFWWLGLLIGTGWAEGSSSWTAPGRGRRLLAYALPALLVPIAYVAALPSWHQPLTVSALWRFVFHDYYAHTAGASLSGRGLGLTVINLGRTFLQVHGSTLALLRQYPALLLVVAGAAGLLGYAAGCLARGWRAHRLVMKKAPAETVPVRIVVRTHLLILGLQLLFAASSEGNAEFMVMVPALVALAAGSRLPWLPARAVAAAGLALLGWNLAFALVPAHQLRFSNTRALLTRIQREPSHWFLLDNPNLVLNQLHYLTGRAAAPPNVWPAPTLLLPRFGQSPARLHAWLRRQLRAGHRVFTDGLGGPQLLDRARLVSGNQNAALLQGFHTQRVDSFPTSFGPYYLTEIR